MYALRQDKPFYYALMVLNAFLWYPIRKESNYLGVFLILSSLLRLVSLLCGLGTLIHIIVTMKNNLDINISEDVGDLTGFVGCMSICSSFLYYHSEWARFFNNVLDFKQFGQPPAYQRIVRRGNLITLVCTIYTVPSMMWYCLVSYMQLPECQANNARKNLNEHCGMINPTWLPFDVVKGTPFAICYIFQTLGIFVYLPSAFAISLILWEAVEIMVARINHLKSIFSETFASNDRRVCVANLRYCIKYHQDIIRVSKELSGLAESTAGSAVLTSALVIGALGSQLLKDSSLKATSFVAGYITAIFIICHAGQRLIDESLDLTNNIYNSRWYEMDAKIRRDIRFVIARCQRPLTLAMPGPMGPAGYLLFFILIKTAYSYLTLLNQMI